MAAVHTSLKPECCSSQANTSFGPFLCSSRCSALPSKSGRTAVNGLQTAASQTTALLQSYSSQGCVHRKRQRRLSPSQATAAVDSALIGVGEIVDVEDVEGIRVLIGDDNRPMIEYLVKWKDGTPPTWEPVENLSDNLVRDFEEKWWKACREGDEEVLRQMLANSKGVLPHCVDTNNRSALHFAAALGKAGCCAMLCEAGAEVDYPDKDGYTALHMAVGYSHVATVKVLLEAGANPEIPDNQGRDVVALVDSLRESMPMSPQLAGKRIALEEVSALLTGNLFEEVFPRKILESRTTTGGGKEYLIQWLDGTEDSWAKECDIARDVIADFESGYDYAEAECLLKMKRRGDQRLYLAKWLDGSPNSWVFEDHISPPLIAAFEAWKYGDASQQDALPEPLELPEQPVSKRAARRARKAARRAQMEAEAALAATNGSSHLQHAVEHSAGSNGNGHDAHSQLNNAALDRPESEGIDHQPEEEVRAAEKERQAVRA